jgi:hypothetical protein
LVYFISSLTHFVAVGVVSFLSSIFLIPSSKDVG